MSNHADATTGSPGLAWRTLKNSFYGMVEFGWPILVALVASPYIVRTLGDDAYGLLSIVGVTLGFFGFLDLGIGGAATRQIAAYYAQEDLEGINTVISTVLVFYLAIGLFGGMTILALTDVMVTKWLSIPIQYVGAARVAFYISAPALTVSLVLGVLGAIPRALQRFDIASKATIVLNTMTTALTLVLLAMGEGLLAVVISGLVLNIVAIPVMFRLARGVLPSLRVVPRFSWKVFRELMTFGTAFLLSSMGVALLYQADKLLLGSMLGVAAVTYYVVPGALAQRIQGLVAAATNIAFPVSSALFESGDYDALRRLYSEGTRLVYILVVMIAVPMAVFADKFLLFWMGAEMARNSGLAMVLLVGTYSILGVSAIPWGIANGSGRASINAAFTLAIAVADIALFVLWVRPYGVVGAAAAYLVSAAVGVPILVWFIERRVVGLSGFAGVRILLPIAGVGLLQVVLALILRVAAVNLWATMGLMVLSALTFPLGYWAFGLVQDGDRRLVSLLLNRIRGASPTASPEA